MRVERLRILALALAIASIPLPWFKVGGKTIRVLDVLATFTAPFYVGLLAAAISVLKSEERYASLLAGILLSSAPAYAYIAVYKVMFAKPALGVGAVLDIIAGILFLLAWFPSLIAWALKRKPSRDVQA